MNFEITTKAAGRFKAQVIDPDGSVAADIPWKSNLILDSGLDLLATKPWNQMLNYAVVGTGTTPTKDTTLSECSQTGTTVTRTTGAYDFQVSDEGKLIHWADGSEAKIVTRNSTTEVVVDRSATVAAQAFDLYRVNQTGLTTEVVRSNTYLAGSSSSTAAADGTITFTRTYDFPVEVGAQNYTEAGVSWTDTVAANIFSRFLFDGAVSVAIGQQLRLTYELVLDLAPLHQATAFDLDANFTDWPVAYNVSAISSGVSSFDVTLDRDHHYDVGDTVVITGAIPTELAVTAGTSTGSDFTITVPGHTFIGTDTIVIAGCTPSAYNGTWTVASVAGDDVTVTTAANPGTMTIFGTARFDTPVSDWYNGEWTVASVPGTTQVSITSAINPVSAGEGAMVGRLTGDLWLSEKAVVQEMGGTSVASTNAWSSALEPFCSDICAQLVINPSSGNTSVWDGASDLTTNPTALGYTLATGVQTSGVDTRSGSVTNSTAAYVAGDHKRVSTMSFPPAAGNQARWTHLMIGGYYLSGSTASGGTTIVYAFTDGQLKENTHILELTLTRNFGRTIA